MNYFIGEHYIIMCRSRAKIVGGIWTLKVPWEKDRVWRTDMFKSVLADERLRQARFILVGGPTVLVSAEDLRRVLVGGHDHWYGHKIWGPFNIDAARGLVNGQTVQIHVEP